MTSRNGIEPEIGKKYRFLYRAPDYHYGKQTNNIIRYTEESIFIGKIQTSPNSEGKIQDVYIFAKKIIPAYRPYPAGYQLNYVFKKDIKELKGEADERFALEDFRVAVKSPSFPHPPLDFSIKYPSIQILSDKLAEIARIERARGTIGNFMTKNVIYRPPMKTINNSGKETTIFTGGPMYKRALANFKSGVAKRKTRKQRGGQALGQPLKYTDATYQEPSANAGFNRLGVEPPYLIRPAQAAIPMRGGAEQILSPMPFKDAYHSAPLAPTGQPLTDLKLPATLRQGLNFGPLSGGRRGRSNRRNTRRNTRRGGFYPSIMGGVVANAPLLAPLAARQGIHLFERYRTSTRRNRRSTRKSNRRRNSGRRA